MLQGAAFPDDLYSGVTFCADLSELSERAQRCRCSYPFWMRSSYCTLGRLWWATCILAAILSTRSMRDHRNTFAMELLPRITRAQSMDALTSQAAVAGYKAVIMGGQHDWTLPTYAHDTCRYHSADAGAGHRGGGGRIARPSPRPSAWGPLWKPTTCAKPLGIKYLGWEHASLARRLTPRAPGLCARTHRGGAAPEWRPCWPITLPRLKSWSPLPPSLVEMRPS